MKKILIVGTSFYNKGAQSMLFICTQEIKRRFNDAVIYFATTETINESGYAFKPIAYDEESKLVALSCVPHMTALLFRIKRAIKIILKRPTSQNKNLLSLRKLMKEINLVVDASGYNIGSNWDDYTHSCYLRNIKLSKKYNIPMVLLPQTFGPFQYTRKRLPLLKKINKYFKYPRIIYCREKEGYDYLTENMGLKNVCLSNDLVLQNKNIDSKLVFEKLATDLCIPECDSFYNKCVGIVPNSQCLKYGNESKIFSLYSQIINEIVSSGINVCIFRHSLNDLPMCELIYKQFIDCENVRFVKNDFNCLEYSSFVKRFNFIVCSRYHGVVNSFKNCIPCITLGWSNKYIELCKLMNQQKYYFDITVDFDTNNLIQSICEMTKCFKKEKKVISNCLFEIQKNNCFNFLDDNILWK